MVSVGMVSLVFIFVYAAVPESPYWLVIFVLSIFFRFAEFMFFGLEMAQRICILSKTSIHGT